MPRAASPRRSVPDDSVGAHVADTLVAGAGLCDADVVADAIAAGPASIAILQALGVSFDRDGARLALGREGAHSADRIVHAGGDATGARVVEALRRAVRLDPRIEVREHTRVRDILVTEGRVRAVLTEHPGGGLGSIAAHAVVLATGGAGQLFARTTNPVTATGDGVALAAQAGAAVADLEMVQFHPTALAVGASPLPLISEAVRGAGAYLRAPDGSRFMPDEHPLAELGPRDVVARAVARTALAQGGEVTLDLRHLDPAWVHGRFPTVSAACAAAGLDLARDPIPGHPGRPLRHRRRARRSRRTHHAARAVRDRRMRGDRPARGESPGVQQPARSGGDGRALRRRPRASARAPGPRAIRSRSRRRPPRRARPATRAPCRS